MPPPDLTPENLRRMADEIEAEVRRNGGPQWERARKLAGQYRREADAIERGEVWKFNGSGGRRIS
jgi:hypothetical protein